MTDAELLATYRDRQAAWAAITVAPRYLAPQKNREFIHRVETASSRFRECDSAITTELLQRGKPAELDGVTLHLTHDRLNFVALRPGTTTPLVWAPGTGRRAREELKRVENCLYDYRKAACRARAAAAV